ncbi:transposase [Methylobacterium sp. Leaf113]|nr:transposase [Methylobacterium sp. Leaf113]
MDALVPDDLWPVISPLLPPEPEKLKGGHPCSSDRSALAGIILFLRTGMQWKHVPGKPLGCTGKTSSRRLGEWQAAGVWANLHRVLPEQLQDANALNWSRAALDIASVPAKKGVQRTAQTQPTAASPAPTVTSSWTPMGYHLA